MLALLITWYMMEKVTAIVAIYKSEKFLPKLIESIIVSDVGKMIDGEVIHIAAGRGTFEFR